MGNTPNLMEMNCVFVSVCVEHMKSHHAEDYSTGVQRGSGAGNHGRYQLP